MRVGASLGALACAAALALGGCSLLPSLGDAGDAPASPTQEAAGPTLGARVPSDWQDVRHSSGLLYSVPPEWTVYGGGGGSGGPGGTSGQTTAPDGAAPSSPGGPADDSTDWGFGVVTTANAEAQRGYCPAPGGDSFRARVGISDPVAGSADDVTGSMARAMGSAMDLVFSENGATVDLGEAEKAGVSGNLAYHQTIRGTPAEPRNACTPPTIRADVLGVSVGTPEDPKTVTLLVMSDEGEPGVEPTETIDTVVGSLRFDNAV